MRRDDMRRDVQSHYSFCEIPLWVVMHNHIHLIVSIDGLKTPWVKRETSARVDACQHDFWHCHIPLDIFLAFHFIIFLSLRQL